jgi:CBS-domain-containing membrane protein
MSATVADAMVRAPKTHGADATVADAREAFRDEHVHAVLVVADGRLLGVVDREDLHGAAAQEALGGHGRLAGRSVGPGVDLDAALRHMRRHRRRRLAVIDDGDRLLGLLCLKRTGTGFCSDADVSARSRLGPAGGVPAPDTAARSPRVDEPSHAGRVGPFPSSSR